MKVKVNRVSVRLVQEGGPVDNTFYFRILFNDGDHPVACLKWDVTSNSFAGCWYDRHGKVHCCCSDSLAGAVMKLRKGWLAVWM